MRKYHIFKGHERGSLKGSGKIAGELINGFTAWVIETFRHLEK
jgi:hypothetical protein